MRTTTVIKPITIGKFFLPAVSENKKDDQKKTEYSALIIRVTNNKQELSKILLSLPPEKRVGFLTSFSSTTPDFIYLFKPSVLADVLNTLPAGTDYKPILTALGEDGIKAMFPNITRVCVALDHFNDLKIARRTEFLIALGKHLISLINNEKDIRELLEALLADNHDYDFKPLMTIIGDKISHIIPVDSIQYKKVLNSLWPEEQKTFLIALDECPKTILKVKISRDDLNVLWNVAQKAKPAPRSVSVFQNASQAETDKERYDILCAYVNDPKNVNESFRMALIEKFGQEAFAEEAVKYEMRTQRNYTR